MTHPSNGGKSTERRRWTTGQQWLLGVASIGPVGNLPASGSWAVVLIGVPLFAILHGISPPVYLLLLFVLALVAVAVHQAGDRLLGTHDSPRLVWDEIVGFLTAVFAVPFTWQTCLVAFIVERALDVAKIPPAGLIERRLPGGWGVVGDDLIAGIYTCVLLHVLRWQVPGWLGLSG